MKLLQPKHVKQSLVATTVQQICGTLVNHSYVCLMNLFGVRFATGKQFNHLGMDFHVIFAM